MANHLDSVNKIAAYLKKGYIKLAEEAGFWVQAAEIRSHRLTKSEKLQMVNIYLLSQKK